MTRKTRRGLRKILKEIGEKSLVFCRHPDDQISKEAQLINKLAKKAYKKLRPEDENDF